MGIARAIAIDIEATGNGRFSNTYRSEDRENVHIEDRIATRGVRDGAVTWRGTDTFSDCSAALVEDVAFDITTRRVDERTFRQQGTIRRSESGDRSEGTDPSPRRRRGAPHVRTRASRRSVRNRDPRPGTPRSGSRYSPSMRSRRPLARPPRRPVSLAAAASIAAARLICQAGARADGSASRGELDACVDLLVFLLEDPARQRAVAGSAKGPAAMRALLEAGPARSCGPRYQLMLAWACARQGDVEAAWRWRFAASFRAALTHRARPDLVDADERLLVDRAVAALDPMIGSPDTADPAMLLRAFDAMLAWDVAHPSPIAPPTLHPEVYLPLRERAERARELHADALG